MTARRTIGGTPCQSRVRHSTHAFRTAVAAQHEPSLHGGWDLLLAMRELWPEARAYLEALDSHKQTAAVELLASARGRSTMGHQPDGVLAAGDPLAQRDP